MEEPATKKEEIGEEDPFSHLPRFSLNIADEVRISQQQYGLRHRDYLRYRQYCTRRLLRIRKSLRFTHGKGRFVKKTLEAKFVHDPKYFMIPLVNAERSWSYAMQLRQDSDDPRKRHHAIKRLRKAVKYANELRRLCTLRGDSRTSLEAEAYASAMEGQLELEKENWEASLKYLLHARELYSNLSRIAGSGVENPLFSQKLSEIEPIIRYCHFNLSREGEEFDATSLLDMRVDTDNEVLRRRVESALEDSRREQAKNLQDVEWNGVKIPMKDATLKNLLLSTREHDYELQKTHTMDERMEIYDNLFIVFNDMLRMLESEKDASMEHYVRFQMLDKMIERNIFLVEADMVSLKWESASKMAKKTLGAVDEMAEIKDVPRDAIQARRYYILALHAYCVGELHGMLHKSAKAVGIFQHGMQLVDTCRSCCEEGNTILSRANELHHHLKRAQLLERARGVLGSSEAEPSNVETMVKDMDLGGARGTQAFVGQKLGDVRHGMDPNVHLCDFPQESFDPVPTKPVFFDVAEQYIMYPDLEGRVEKKRSGFFGLFSR